MFNPLKDGTSFSLHEQPLLRCSLRFCLLVLASVFCLSAVVRSQVTVPGSANDTIHDKNFVFLGSEKLVSSISFSGIAAIEQKVFYGTLRLDQAYRGSTMKGLNGVFRDDNLMKIDYDLNIYKNLFAVLHGNWLYSSASKQVALNKFERLSGLAGLRLYFLTDSYLEASAGAEKNVQVGERFRGAAFNARSALKDININDFILKADASGNYSALSEDRISSDFDGKASFERQYDSSNAMSISMKYRVLNGDYFNPPTQNAERRLSFENRLEQRVAGDALLDFSFNKELLTNIRFSFGSGTVERQYKNVIPDITQTKIIKQISDNQFFISGNLKYVSRSFFQSIGMSLNTRTEKNAIKKKEFILPNEEIDLQSLESYSDYNYSTTSLFAQSRLNASKKDVLTLDYSVSIFRYNTPAKTNYFDKDEFSTIAILAYNRKVSEILAARITADLNMSHTVNLMAQRSSENTWKRNIRLSPQIILKTPVFYMEPAFEVLANYMVYDFLNPSLGERSYSQRLIGYSDSFYVKLPEYYSLQAKIISRYSERGILYWKEFAESVQNSNFEQFVKLLLFVNIKSDILMGFGGRLYNISQKMAENASGAGLPDYSLLSYGPELVLRYGFPGGTYVFLQGWYEFQNINNTDKRMFPNFTLQTNIKL